MEAIMAAATPENAISLLKADHRKVADLFEQFEEKGSHKRRLAEQICLELTIHTKIEEEIFYPACDGIVDAASLKEAYVEHDGAKVLIAEIEAGSPASDDYYEAKVKVLSEMIKHHVTRKNDGSPVCSRKRSAAISTWMPLARNWRHAKKSCLQSTRARVCRAPTCRPLSMRKAEVHPGNVTGLTRRLGRRS